MKRTLLTISLAALAFCACDKLNTAPQDYYASGNYWTTASQVEGYMPAIYNQIRNLQFTHQITFGELGAGAYVQPVSISGNSVSNPTIILHTLSDVVPGVANWGNYYTALSHINLFIEKTEAAEFMPEAEKAYLLGEAYGLRAFLYFDLYRIYGGVPLRLIADVAGHGTSDVNELYLERSTATKTVDQIMTDVKKSISCFGDQKGFDPYGMGNKVHWNKAASECLAAEVLLWNTKVTVGDYTAKSDGTLLAEAKTYLNNVVSNYGLALQDDFAKVFASDNKANSEIIYAIHYGEDDGVYNSNTVYTYPTSAGTFFNRYDKNGNLMSDYLSLKNYCSNHTYEYLPAFYLNYDGTAEYSKDETKLVDTRAMASFMPAYDKDGENFKLVGSIFVKNMGEIIQGARRMTGDIPIYRLSWVYLTLAEIANYEGKEADFVKNINLVRERAYASNWNDKVYGVEYKDFATNELEILSEKDKELLQEGQRWWDIRRLQTVKGDPSKNIIFSKVSDPVYRIDPSKAKPVLAQGEEFRALWPISKTILDNDPKLAGHQNPGY